MTDSDHNVLEIARQCMALLAGLPVGAAVEVQARLACALAFNVMREYGGLSLSSEAAVVRAFEAVAERAVQLSEQLDTPDPRSFSAPAAWQ